MRMLFLLAAIFVALVAVGVIHFQKNGDNINVSIDENKLRQETAKVVREGEEIVNDAQKTLQDSSQSQTLGQQISNEAHRLVPAQSQQ